MARAKDSQPSLFATAPAAPEAVPADAPLAEHAAADLGGVRRSGASRRRSAAAGDMIEGQRLHSLILWGPPGTGKTSLARLIARSTDAHFIAFSAVLSGVKELRVVVEERGRSVGIRSPRDPLRRRDPSLQQGAAGRVPSARRGRHHRPHRGHDREPLVRDHRAAALARVGAGPAAAACRRSAHHH